MATICTYGELCIWVSCGENRESNGEVFRTIGGQEREKTNVCIFCPVDIKHRWLLYVILYGSPLI